MRSLIHIFVATSFFLTTGCASIVSDTRYPVTVDSEASGQLTVEDQQGTDYYEGGVPANVTLSASDGFFQPAQYEATLVTDNGNEVTESFGASLDGWYIGNILLGGAIGFLIVDPATGAMWKLKPAVQINAPSEMNAQLQYGPNRLPAKKWKKDSSGA